MENVHGRDIGFLSGGTTFTTFRKPPNNFISVPINQYLKYTIQKLF